MTERVAGMVLLLLGSVACGESARAAQPPIDSMGVRLVEYRVDTEHHPRYTINESPIASIDARRLDSAVGGSLWQRGNIVAVERSDRSWMTIDRSRVWTLTQQGNALASAGRAGTGPGEFVELRSLCLTRGDTAVAYDQGNARIGIVSPEGRLSSVRPLQGTVLRDACFDDGTIATLRTVTAGARSPEWSIEREALDGRLIAAIATLPATSVDRGVVYPVHVVAHAQHLFVVDSKSGEIRRHSAQGMLLATWRSDIVRPVMSGREHARLLELQFPSANARRQTLRRPVRQDGEVRPLTWPFFGDARSDHSGGLWVSAYIRWPGDPWQWTHFDSTGTIQGVLDASALSCGRAPCRVVGFGRGTVQLAQQDEDGFLGLSVHAFRRSGSANAR